MGEQLESLAMAVYKTAVYGIKTPISDSRYSNSQEELQHPFNKSLEMQQGAGEGSELWESMVSSSSEQG